MISALLTALLLTVTAYAPACGAINGSADNYYADGSSRPQAAHSLRVVACGKRFAFGTRFRIHGLEHLGVTDVECRDRGGSVTGLDVLVFTERGCAADRRDAFEIGRRSLTVEVLP